MAWMSTSTEIPRRRLILATGGTMLALLLAALDQTVVGTALPRIVSELHGVELYPWVITAYLVCSTSMTPIAGKLGDLFGRKPVLLVAMIGFLGGSALCGLAGTMTQLIVFRAFQGLFAGFIFGTVFSVVADLYPPQQRGKIQGLLGSVFSVASILGPPTGGLLTDYVSWRWVFYVNVPVAIVAVLFVAIAMPYSRTKASWRDIDFRGAAALIGFMAPLMVALSMARSQGWASPLVDSLLVLTAVMLGAFLFIESRTKTPIVPLWLFKIRSFTIPVLIVMFTAFGMFATIIYGPLLFQGVLGLSPTFSGALTIPMSLGQISAAVATGFAMQHIVRYRWLGVLGIAFMIMGLWNLSAVTVDTDRLTAIGDVLMIGLGLGTTYPLTMLTVQNSLPRQIVGVASGQVQFFRAVGGTFAVAILGTILTQRWSGDLQSELSLLALPAHLTALANALHDVYLTAGVLVCVALVGSLFLREAKLTAAQPAREPVREPAVALPGEPVFVNASATAITPTTATATAGANGSGAVEVVIERIGLKYVASLEALERARADCIADLRAVAAETAKVYESQLAAKDLEIAALIRRAEGAERQRAELDGRIYGLEDELLKHQADLRGLIQELQVMAEATERDRVAVRSLVGSVSEPAGSLTSSPGEPGEYRGGNSK